MKIHADITVTLHEYFDIEPFDPTRYARAESYTYAVVDKFKQQLESTYPGQLDDDACMRIYLSDDYGDHRVEVCEVLDGKSPYPDEQFEKNWDQHKADIIRYLREEEE